MTMLIRVWERGSEGMSYGTVFNKQAMAVTHIFELIRKKRYKGLELGNEETGWVQYDIGNRLHLTKLTEKLECAVGLHEAFYDCSQD